MKIKVTRGQLRRLKADIMAIPRQPVGEHLTTEQRFKYAREKMSSEELEHAETHLASCEMCSKNVERLSMAGRKIP